MEENIFYSYINLNEQIAQYSYAQITDYLGFTIAVENPFFKCLTKNGLYYLVYMDEAIGRINFYDISGSCLITKAKLFFGTYHNIDYTSLQNAIKCFKPLNEFIFEGPKKLNYIRTIFFGNTNRNLYQNTFQSFSSLCSHPWFDKFITYNKKLSMFNLPMFNNERFATNNFIDFNENTIKLRYNTPFSVFYPITLKDAYQQIETGETNLYNINNIRENQLIICFNPLLLIEASTSFKINLINYIPVVLEPNFDYPKFLSFRTLINPFIFEKVILLYSKEKPFYYKDLLNTSLFLIYSANMIQNDFYFEFNLSAANIFTLIITRSKDFNFSKFDIFLTQLTDTLNNEYAGRNNSGFTKDVVQSNIDFLRDYTYQNEVSRFDKTNIFFITFDFKVETAQIFCDWMIERFLNKFSTRHVSGLDVFNDKAF